MTVTFAIVGRPNVGKSTLFNRLIGRQHAIVDDQPGVTRDRREGQGYLATLAFTVIDTAGLEETYDGSLEARMRRQTEMAIRDADFRDQAPDIAVPTVCVVGDQDGATPPDLVRGTADMIPGAKFELVKDAGHIPCAEQPAAIIKIIRDVVAGL